MVLIFRALLFILIAIGLYWCFKFFLNPQRKMTQALEEGRTLIMDDKKVVHRNMLIAFKGVLFEAEKYMGTTEEAFQIIKIHVWPRDNQKLVGLEKKDFQELNRIIKARYPYADISWKSPIKELLHD
jgi:hypothetical protein